LRSAAEYKCLRAALIAGGVPPENLDILTSTPIDDEPLEEPEWRQSPVRPPYLPKRSVEAKIFVPKSNLTDNQRSNPQSTVPTPDTQSCTGDECEATSIENEDNEYYQEEEEEEYYENNHEDRSLTFRGLSPFTTLADVLKHVKGGLILNAFKRPKSAHIAFVDPIAAEKFLMYSKRADLYIRNKRVQLKVQCPLTSR
jgi:hypothetical protein